MFMGSHCTFRRNAQIPYSNTVSVHTITLLSDEVRFALHCYFSYCGKMVKPFLAVNYCIASASSIKRDFAAGSVPCALRASRISQ